MTLGDGFLMCLLNYRVSLEISHIENAHVASGYWWLESHTLTRCCTENAAVSVIIV